MFQKSPQYLLIKSVIIISILTAAGCTDDIEFHSQSITHSCSGNTEDIFHAQTQGHTDLEYTLDLGDQAGDVFFIFTNTDTQGSTQAPEITETPENSLWMPPAASFQKSGAIDSESEGRSVFIKGRPDVTEFNRNPFDQIDESPRGFKSVTPFAENKAVDDKKGDTAYFKIDKNGNTVEALCTNTVTDVDTSFGQKTLNIWIAKDCWYDGGTKTYKVTPAMASKLAEKFLSYGENNDIYDWVTNIFGEEWGLSDYTNLIPPDSNITILLYDIENDDIENFISGEIYTGYFWSKDNFRSNYVSYSNERIIFYIDAVVFARNEGLWEITDPGPQEAVSTLAHEFQHMIHFYQKNILRTGSKGSKIWLNEMCSLVTEDLLADKLKIKGPRGIVPDDPSAGISGNTHGRLPLFNYHDDASVTGWDENPKILQSYAACYSFGAYLARNFGGPVLFKDIVHSGLTDYRAVERALHNSGSDISFASLLRMWGAAVLLSDRVNPENNYIYNRGNYWLTQTSGGTAYSLGSINLYNYEYKTQDGPRFYLIQEMSQTGSLSAASNTYVYAGSMSGTANWQIRMMDNVKLTVVVKKQP